MRAFLLTFALILGCDKNRDVDTAEIAFGDLDGDGFSVADGDCNDDRPDMSPAGSELCDGLDNDCDGVIDENTASRWFVDGYGDGYGSGEGVGSCTQPGNYVPIDGDCDDEDPTVHPNASEECDGDDDDCDGQVDNGVTTAFFSDADQDGYGDPDSPVMGCEPTDGTVDNDFDCDDDDPEVNPAAQDGCNDLDDDCDGDLDEDPDIGWYQDKDGDGYGGGDADVYSCDEQEGLTSDGGDSDDYDNSVSPGHDELCDGIDNDSDGVVDEGDAVDAGTWYEDADSDGYGDEQSTTTACTQPSGYVAIAGDTDDGSDKVNPGADEYCDGVDNDSDGVVDEGDALDALLWTTDSDGDGFGDENAAGVYACSQPSGYADGSDCDDTDASVYPGATETCDGVDQDCDGTVDDNPSDGSTWYQDWDSDSYGNASITTQGCTAPSGYVSDNTDCDDTVASTHPGADEYCDGADDDCDGTVDESPVDSQTWYYDSDADGYGATNLNTTSCSQPSGYTADAGDCDDGNSGINPGASEVCDTVDNDCDGAADEADATDASDWYRDFDGDGFGNPNKTTPSCTEPAGYVSDNTDCDDTDPSALPGGTEVCDGLDNDCDGNADWGLSVGVDYSTIQDAIDDAINGDEICVPSGTYNEDIDFGGKIILLEGEGSGVTTIEGTGGGPVVTFENGETSVTQLTGFTITGGKAAAGAGVYIDEASPTLTDLIIEANTCASTTSSSCAGVGVYITDGDPTLSDLLIEDNTSTGSGDCYGVGIYMAYGTVTLDGVTIDDNSGSCRKGYGIGVRVATDASLTATDTTISNNTYSYSNTYYTSDSAIYGVGLDTSGAFDLDLDGVTVEGNSASITVYYAATQRGAGLALRGVDATLTDVIVDGNAFTSSSSSTSANTLGAGIYVSGSATVEFTSVDVTSNDITNKGYAAAQGAGMYVSGTDLTVDDLLVWDNALIESGGTNAGVTGGGLVLNGASGTWDHVMVLENDVYGRKTYAAGLYVQNAGLPTFTNLIVSGNTLTGDSSTTAVGYGSGVFANSYGYPTLINADIVANTCSVGSCYGGGYTIWNNGGIDLLNTNIAHNTADSGGAIYAYSSSSVFFSDIEYSNFYDNGTSAFRSVSTPVGSDGSIAADPAYTDITGSSDSLEWDLSLGSSSTCIDAGDPSVLDSDGTTSDIGAYGGPDGNSW